MRLTRFHFVLFAVFVVGIGCGYQVARYDMKTHLMLGFCSGHYYPALSQIRKAKAKLDSGDSNVREEVTSVERYLTSGDRVLNSYFLP